MSHPTGSRVDKHAKGHAGACNLVLDGNQVKARLIAERTESGVPVHVDWVRFTCHLRNAPMPSVDVLFPEEDLEPLSQWDRDQRTVRIQRLRKFLRFVPDADFSPSVQAFELAERVAEALGSDFSVHPEAKKGHDFYRCRWSIERNGAEVGWVGFLASGDGPRQRAQAKTIHVNVYGSACTFAQSGWRDHLANVIDETKGWLTRIDLALDFFDGLSGGMERVKADYEAGLCDVGGRRLKCNMVGDWCGGKARSFYVGTKEVGKQTNVYEKGHQLFGDADTSAWIRAELRWGNKARFLETDMLRRPADYFHGASDWHASLLREAEAISFPVTVPCERKRQIETVQGEAVRNVRWLREVAAPSLAIAFEYLGVDHFMELVCDKKAPGRLQKFSRGEIAAAYGAAFERSKKVSHGADVGHVMA
ncbi:replication initiation factor domain-containing protein [Paracidovorax konjaci]|uniref:Replication initiation factor n=1 Tax=Paracidovorax konjaci TaxID=32040 RepID=A0A1I1VVW9_9BURK|nr:replication initiation factor domain-containing protein [Paracidovorax konjaci]SFD87107.1 Replication initiation factor [Paracidovorax konjaci]